MRNLLCFNESKSCFQRTNRPTRNPSTRWIVSIKGKEKPQTVIWGCLQRYLHLTWVESVSQMQIPERTLQLVSTGRTISKPTDSSNNWYEPDHLFNELQDLVNPQFRAWYCREFYRLGRDKVLILASQARVDGKEPRKLFSSLLKKTK